LNLGVRKHKKERNRPRPGGGGDSPQSSKKKTPAYSVVRHNWNFKWDWLLWSDETKEQQTLNMGLVNTGIKVPHVYN